MKRLPVEERFNQMRQLLKDGPQTVNQLARRMGYQDRSSLSWLFYEYGLPKGVKRHFDPTYATRGIYWYYLVEHAAKLSEIPKNQGFKGYRTLLYGSASLKATNEFIYE